MVAGPDGQGPREGRRVRAIPAGSVILTPAEARMLYQAARIGELRRRHRVGSSALYDLLTDISVAAFTEDAARGNEPRQSAASEERGTWTVRHLASYTGRAPRTIRLDIETGALPATKNGNLWTIGLEDAKAYISIRRK